MRMVEAMLAACQPSSWPSRPMSPAPSAQARRWSPSSRPSSPTAWRGRPTWMLRGASEAAVRAGGAVPATIAHARRAGSCVGLDDAAAGAAGTGARRAQGLASEPVRACWVVRGWAGTTVSATMIAARWQASGCSRPVASAASIGEGRTPWTSRPISMSWPERRSRSCAPDPSRSWMSVARWRCSRRGACRSLAGARTSCRASTAGPAATGRPCRVDDAARGSRAHGPARRAGAGQRHPLLRAAARGRGHPPGRDGGASSRRRCATWRRAASTGLPRPRPCSAVSRSSPAAGRWSPTSPSSSTTQPSPRAWRSRSPRRARPDSRSTPRTRRACPDHPADRA